LLFSFILEELKFCTSAISSRRFFISNLASLAPVTPLRGRMIEDMKLAGLSEKTQACYVDAVKNLRDATSPKDYFF